MTTLIFDSFSRRCIGSIEGDGGAYNGNGLLVDAASLPSDLNIADFGSLFLGNDDTTVTQDVTAVLVAAKTARKTRIKQESAKLIDALDWKLARANERYTAGLVGIAEVDVVLAEREAIRQSSNAAEAAVDALTDAGSVQVFTWSVSVPVTPPRRVSAAEFFTRFTDTEVQNVLTAAQTQPAVQALWEKFRLNDFVNLDAVETQAGVQALELAALIGIGRAAEVLA